METTDDTLGIVECPTCESLILLAFTLGGIWTDKAGKISRVGYLSFGICMICIKAGDDRTVRLFSEQERDIFTAQVNDDELVAIQIVEDEEED